MYDKEMVKDILVVDDQESMLEVIQLVLETENYSVNCVTNSRDMRKEIKKKVPHLILLDIYLHQEYGGDIAKRLKKDELTMHVPIILISADTHIGEVTQKSGADAYIAKPFNIDDLLAKVALLTTA